MYKRFIRWASDRLANDGIIAFITNRAYLDTRQDDGFRKIAAREFSDIYVLDLGSDVRRNPKISGTTHNVFGIQTGVAIGFFVRGKAKRGQGGVHYARREDAELARDKLAYLAKTNLSDIAFENITPDSKSNWLNQPNTDFDSLIPVADKQTKFAKNPRGETGCVWATLSMGSAPIGTSGCTILTYVISVTKCCSLVTPITNCWTTMTIHTQRLSSGAVRYETDSHVENRIVYNDANRIASSVSPIHRVKHCYFAEALMNDRLTENHYTMFGAI